MRKAVLDTLFEFMYSFPTFVSLYQQEKKPTPQSVFSNLSDTVGKTRRNERSFTIEKVVKSGLNQITTILNGLILSHRKMKKSSY